VNRVTRQKQYRDEVLYFHKCFNSGPSASAPQPRRDETAISCAGLVLKNIENLNLADDRYPIWNLSTTLPKQGRQSSDLLSVPLLANSFVLTQ
jgi:hypothetical protein